MFKSLIIVHSAKKMDNYVRELWKKEFKRKEKKKKKSPKESAEHGLVHWEDPEGVGRVGGGRGDWDGEYM